MSKTVFTNVTYDLSSIISAIAMGDIGLPDIQRPFVWKNIKVRDLFDSMYKGYPVGYLLFWKNALAGSTRSIGADTKQKVPQLMIVDGQQRLTSLYAVIKGIPVLRQNFEHESIQIAFNPLEEKFDVADAAIRRDKSFIPDISILWSSEANIILIINNYIHEIKSARSITEEEKLKAQGAILKLQGLLSFPFTALELDANISEEDVSDVFVRINSKGTPLNQADFILTLMSVFWDEGRTELEHFCREAKKPTKGQASPFNHFIEPSPDQLLRVSVGLAFKRARLRYVYSILRGKDLDTEQFSEERRIAQFAVLAEAQGRALNLQYWHDFLACIRQAGFRSGRMISSQNNLIFAYILYLIGRTEYKVDEFTLRNTIARWFFMSSLTGRFTGSPESAMEFDLAQLREISDADGFVGTLNQVCDTTLTNDYWAVTLPNDLATSSSRSPSLFAFQAAQVILDARVLFSKARVTDLLDPTINARRSAAERHHLFPKGYLQTLGISDIRETNQIANYTLVEWGDNIKISAQSPAEYLPVMRERVTSAALAQMYHLHALPENWEHLDYQDFLKVRREAMAQVIHEAFDALSSEDTDEGLVPAELDIEKIIKNGESAQVEFKSTLRTNLHTGDKDVRMENTALKTIAGFLNTNGGTLVIGVSDDGKALGIEQDGFPNEDKMSLHLVNIVKDRMGPLAMTVIHPHFEEHGGKRVLAIDCQRASSAVFVKEGTIEKFYIRTGPSTTELSASQTQEYIGKRFGK